ncbi:MAG: hypothetical protein HC769_31025 [Cyanobacteria bacterium CRU_2_1]|nr:hypothetical protein [Cyanobacteria bacterium CRU_2_1]
MLAGCRSDRFLYLTAFLTPDRVHSHCLHRSLPERFATADRFTHGHPRSPLGRGETPDRFTYRHPRSLLGRGETPDRLQPRVQHLDAEPANGPAERLQTTFAILPRSFNSPLQPGCYAALPAHTPEVTA